MPQVSAVAAQKAVYDYDHVFSCLCLIEEIVAPNLSGEPWQAYRDQWGISGVRDLVIEKLAGACTEAWLVAYERYEKADATYREAKKNFPVADDFPGMPPQPDDPGSFDYEFVPFWLRTCVDWSGNHPRIKGKAS